MAVDPTRVLVPGYVSIAFGLFEGVTGLFGSGTPGYQEKIQASDIWNDPVALEAERQRRLDLPPLGKLGQQVRYNTDRFLLKRLRELRASSPPPPPPPPTAPDLSRPTYPGSPYTMADLASVNWGNWPQPNLGSTVAPAPAPAPPSSTPGAAPDQARSPYTFRLAVPKPAPKGPPKRPPRRRAPPKPRPPRRPPRVPPRPRIPDIPIRIPRRLPLPLEIIRKVYQAGRIGFDEALRRLLEAQRKGPPTRNSGTSPPSRPTPPPRPSAPAPSSPPAPASAPDPRRAVEVGAISQPAPGPARVSSPGPQPRVESPPIRAPSAPTLPALGLNPALGLLPLALAGLALGTRTSSSRTNPTRPVRNRPGIPGRPAPGIGQQPGMGLAEALAPLRAPQEALDRCWTQCRRSGPRKKRKKRVCITPAKAAKLGLTTVKKRLVGSR